MIWKARRPPWSPREVVIHRRTDLDGGLFLCLENPTPRTHVFEAPGLFEQIVEGPEAPTVKPLRVYVGARGDRASPGQHRTVTP